MLRIPLIAFFICCSISLSFAQDSVKKVKPVPAGSKYKTYKYHTYRTRAVKIDSASRKVPVRLPLVVKPDTTARPQAPVDKSLNGQYHYLLTKVYYYQQPLISALWKNASDSMNVNRHKLIEAQNKLKVQSKLVDSLNTELNGKDQTLLASYKKVNSVDLLGLTVSKQAYNYITWGLVLIFGVTALIVILRSGGYSREAKYRIKLYEELEEDFKSFKAKANDKEIKLARELQTERNKLDELMGR